MQIKQGATPAFKPEMRVVRKAADIVWKKHSQELVITSGCEAVPHSAGSYHPCGWAEDYRTRYFPTIEEVREVALELAAQIGALIGATTHTFSVGKYQVVIEKDHIHVEYEGDR